MCPQRARVTGVSGSSPQKAQLKKKASDFWIRGKLQWLLLFFGWNRLSDANSFHLWFFWSAALPRLIPLLFSLSPGFWPPGSFYPVPSWSAFSSARHSSPAKLQSETEDLQRFSFALGSFPDTSPSSFGPLPALSWLWTCLQFLSSAPSFPFSPSPGVLLAPRSSLPGPSSPWGAGRWSSPGAGWHLFFRWRWRGTDFNRWEVRHFWGLFCDGVCLFPLPRLWTFHRKWFLTPWVWWRIHYWLSGCYKSLIRFDWNSSRIPPASICQIYRTSVQSPLVEFCKILLLFSTFLFTHTARQWWGSLLRTLSHNTELYSWARARCPAISCFFPSSSNFPPPASRRKSLCPRGQIWENSSPLFHPAAIFTGFWSFQVYAQTVQLDCCTTRPSPSAAILLRRKQF